jgi:hypothetical protein
MAASGISFCRSFQGMFIDIVRFPFSERTGTGVTMLYNLIKKTTIVLDLFMSLWFKVEW